MKTSHPADRLISVVLPVYNESGNIQPCLRGLWASLAEIPHEIIVCYDFDDDDTLPAIKEMTDPPPTLRLVKNDLGPGVFNAIKKAFAVSRGDIVVSTMADLSDPPELIPVMADKIRRGGAAVVSGSRYMPGGAQIGGPWLKRNLSRLAGITLHGLMGLGTHDGTTNFRAYRKEFLDQVVIESHRGFELALELTVKAHIMGLKVDEVPTVWKDRSNGQSQFKLLAWLPHYLKWYLKAMGHAFLPRRNGHGRR